MSLYQLLIKLRNIWRKDSYELLLYAQWLASKPDCRKCVKDNRFFNKIPNCSKCVPARSIIYKNSGKGESNV